MSNSVTTTKRRAHQPTLVPYFALVLAPCTTGDKSCDEEWVCFLLRLLRSTGCKGKGYAGGVRTRIQRDQTKQHLVASA
jgi:hypothetical protein